MGDIESLDETQEEAKYNMIFDKFKFCEDLAQCTKLSVQELLQLSSKKICAKILKMTVIAKDTLCLIDQFIGLKFFKETIVPRAWFTLLTDNWLDNAKFNKMTKDLHYRNERFLSSTEVKNNLHELISQVACCRKFTSNQKK